MSDQARGSIDAESPAPKADNARVGAWRDYSASLLGNQLTAALDAFAEHGYHGTSVRDIASRAGLSVPGLYHHYPSKQSMLQGLLELTMDDLLARVRAAIDEAGADPSQQFDAVVEALLGFHIHRRAQAFIGSTETRSIDSDYHDIYLGRRRDLQHMVDSIIHDCVRAGLAQTGDPADTGRAITTMCVGVSTWYRPDGDLSPVEIIIRFTRIARATAGFAPAASSVADTTAEVSLQEEGARWRST